MNSNSAYTAARQLHTILSDFDHKHSSFQLQNIWSENQISCSICKQVLSLRTYINMFCFKRLSPQNHCFVIVFLFAGTPLLIRGFVAGFVYMKISCQRDIIKIKKSRRHCFVGQNKQQTYYTVAVELCRKNAN